MTTGHHLPWSNIYATTMADPKREWEWEEQKRKRKKQWSGINHPIHWINQFCTVWDIMNVNSNKAKIEWTHIMCIVWSHIQLNCALWSGPYLYYVFEIDINFIIILLDLNVGWASGWVDETMPVCVGVENVCVFIV